MRESSWSGSEVDIDYTNHRGERSIRRIRPRSIRFDRTLWHAEPQWLLDAFDVSKQVDRTFALKDVHRWLPCCGEGCEPLTVWQHGRT